MKSIKKINKYLTQRINNLTKQIDQCLNPHKCPYSNVFDSAHQIYGNQLIAIKEELNQLKEWINNE